MTSWTASVNSHFLKAPTTVRLPTAADHLKVLFVNRELLCVGDLNRDVDQANKYVRRLSVRLCDLLCRILC